MNVAKTITRTSAILASASLALTAVADLPVLDSSQFGKYKYEMDVLPTAVDADASGAVDFTSSADPTWLSLSAGAMTMNMTSGGQYLMSAAANGAAGDAWVNMNPTSATGGSGYTIETLLKIDSQVSGTTYALNLQACTQDTTTYNAGLNFKTTGVYWGSTPLTSSGFDATTWHTYRVVREGGAEEKLFSVYIDGVLVGDSLGKGLDTGTSNYNRLILGSPGAANYKGKATVAYLRFTKGAYAPPAAPSGKAAKKWSGEFPVQYEMTANDPRFIGPSAGGTEWSGSVNGATITQNGVLTATVPTGATAWWSNSLWRASIGSDTAYTVEFRAQILSRRTTENDRVIQIACGNPRDAAVFYIGTNTIQWEPAGISTVQTLASGDNTDAMHTFRIEYSGAAQNGLPYAYTLWRDDEVIGTNLKGSTTYNSTAVFPNLLRFGVTTGGKDHGGSFEIDYIRWTTDGAWDYKKPPEAFTLVFR